MYSDLKQTSSCLETWREREEKERLQSGMEELLAAVDTFLFLIMVMVS